MTDKNKNVSLLLLLGVLFFALPLHADELTEEQEQQLGALWDEAADKADKQDYQGALKITEKALGKLEQWQSDKIYRLDFISVQVEFLHRDEKFDVALDKQKELLSLTKDLFGDDAPETVEARVVRNDLEKIAALTPEQQKELSEGEAAYHAAVDEADLEKAIKLGEQMAAKEKKYLGEDCTWYANSLLLLADNYIATGKYNQAEAKYQQNLKITEKLYGPDHPDVALGLNNLALLYSDQAKYAEAEPLYKRALEIREKALGPDHPDVANSLSNLALLYSDQAKYAEAEPLYKRALAIDEKALGPDHPDLALDLNILAGIYQDQGKYAEAEPLYKRALAIDEKALGPDHPDLALDLNILAGIYQDQGKYAEAEPLYERSLAIKEKSFGPDHPNVAVGLNNLALLYHDQGKYAEAEPLYGRALAIFEKAFGLDHPDVAASLGNLAGLYSDQGKYAEAEPLAKRALAICEKALGPDHPSVASCLGSLGVLHIQQGRFSEATPLLKRALAINERALGLDDPNVAVSLYDLATLYSNLGKYAEAESLFKRALEINEGGLGLGHLNVARDLSGLAQVYRIQGKLIEAERLLKRALAINEKSLGPDSPVMAHTLSVLADILKCQGRDFEVELLEERVLEIYEKAFGPDHPSVAKSLSQFVLRHSGQGKYGKAEAVLKRAIKIQEKALGPDHPNVAASLGNLAGLYLTQDKKYTEAESLIKRALKINEDALQPDHVNQLLISDLAQLYMAQGKFAKAEPLFHRSLTIAEKTYGPRHPCRAFALFDLGMFHHSNGSFPEALSYMARGLNLHLNQLEVYATVLSERQLLANANFFYSEMGEYIDACLQMEEKYDDAYRLHLIVKGAVTRREQLMRSFADLPELAPLFAQLQSTASQLSTAYSSKKQIDLALREQRISKLTKQKEAIEQQLSRQSQSFRQAVRQVTIQDLQTSLPPNSVLIDFCEHTETEEGFKVNRLGNNFDNLQFRLAAFIVRPEGPIELVDLCDYEDFQRALTAWKQNLGRNTGPATELGKLIWEPLAEYVDDAELVLYSPIAELGSVPFAALPGKEPGSYLLEEKQLVMIPQAKLLPSLLEREQSPKPTVLAIGGVDYESVAENETEEPVQLVDSRRAVRWNDEALFTPLPETESELEAVGKLYNQQFDLGKLQTLKDDRATEAAVKRLAPQYSHLHFATHGFFAPPEVKSALDNSENQFARQLSFDDQPRFTGFHPGLLSGLALAGANDPPEEGEDGIWTAEEVATMNLSNVDLAVLSACETGLGKVAGGEGLLGLQRAFQVSGAGTTVASLWQVDDAATRVLMDEFYRNLWEKKLPKIEALRQAQLKMLRGYDPQVGTLRGVGGVRQFDTDGQPERLPPSYWAAWVLSGDWR